MRAPTLSTHPRRRRAALAVVGSSAVAALGAGAAHAAPVVIEQGHVDYGVRMIDGTLRSQVKDDTTGSAVWREPADVEFVLRRPARTTVPSASAFSFLGAPGSPLWLIPQVQKPSVVWLGWNTEQIGEAQGVTGPVTWSLDAVDGPGAVTVFQNDSFGQPTVRFDSRDGLPDVSTIDLGVHAHGNWSFSAPGTYRLTTTHEAPTTSGVQRDTEQLVVRVEDALSDGGGSGGGTGGGSSGGGTGSGGSGSTGGSSGGAGGGDTGGGTGGSGGGTSGAASASRIAVRSSSASLSRARRTSLRLRCTGSATCTGRVQLRTLSRLRSGGRRAYRTVGPVRYRVPAGRTKIVWLRASAKVARALRTGRRRSVAVRATARPDGARPVNRRLRLRLR